MQSIKDVRTEYEYYDNGEVKSIKTIRTFENDPCHDSDDDGLDLIGDYEFDFDLDDDDDDDDFDDDFDEDDDCDNCDEDDDDDVGYGVIIDKCVDVSPIDLVMTAAAGVLLGNAVYSIVKRIFSK